MVASIRIRHKIMQQDHVLRAKKLATKSDAHAPVHWKSIHRRRRARPADDVGLLVAKILQRCRRREVLRTRQAFAGSDILFDSDACRQPAGVTPMEHGHCAAEYLVNHQPKTTMDERFHFRESLGCWLRISALASLRSGRQIVRA